MQIKNGQNIAVIKLNIAGVETWRYSGRIIENTGHSITIEAHFNRNDLPFHGILLRWNDLFIETYYNNRWYNIFEIHDRDSGSLKGWYCNITRPAVFSDSQITYVDLALDLLVFPDYSQLILDEDEFERLALDPGEQTIARNALQELQQLFNQSVNEKIQPRFR